MEFSRQYVFINDFVEQRLYRLLFLTPTGATGLGMLLVLVVMWICSRRIIRDSSYGMFIATHHLFIAFLLMTYIHASG